MPAITATENQTTNVTARTLSSSAASSSAVPIAPAVVEANSKIFKTEVAKATATILSNQNKHAANNKWQNYVRPSNRRNFNHQNEQEQESESVSVSELEQHYDNCSVIKVQKLKLNLEKYASNSNSSWSENNSITTTIIAATQATTTTTIPSVTGTTSKAEANMCSLVLKNAYNKGYNKSQQHNESSSNNNYTSNVQQQQQQQPLHTCHYENKNKHKNRQNNRKFRHLWHANNKNHNSSRTIRSQSSLRHSCRITTAATATPTAAHLSVTRAFNDISAVKMSSNNQRHINSNNNNNNDRHNDKLNFLIHNNKTTTTKSVAAAKNPPTYQRNEANVLRALLTSLLLNSTLLATHATLMSMLAAAAAAAASTVEPTLYGALLNDSIWGNGNLTALNDFESLPGGGVGGRGGDVAIAGVNGGDKVVAATGASNGDISFNDSDDLIEEEDAEYIFDRTDVRIIFITLYTLVFCCCFFGNLLVILVVTLSRRLRSITNFFLANLALADFCVGLFCVMQNLSIYLIDSWVFGEFLCRMYQFVHSLSYTASIFILVVICMERYFAIVHPITCKQILTAARLRMVILTVWITSAVYSTPKFVFSKTIKNIHTEDGQEEEICVLDRKMFNSKLLDMINFGLLYVIPLLVMTVLYSKIAIALWRSSHGLTHHFAAQQQQQQAAAAAQQHQQQHQHPQQQQQQQPENSMSMHNSMYHHHHAHHHHVHMAHNHNHQAHSGSMNLHNHHMSHNQPHATQQHANQQHAQQQQLPGTPLIGGSGGRGGGGGGGGLLSRKQSSKYEKRGVSITESQVSLDSDRPIVSACRQNSSNSHKHSFISHHTSTHQQRPRVAHMSHSSNNVLRARRGVVRMLIIFVLTFALCNLPYHARKMWQYWSRSYRGDSNFNALLTPLTFLVTYFNSGVNPLLYAFLSRNFRKGMKELLLCSWKKGKGKSSSNSSMHHKRMALQTHSLPTDTTHIGNEQL